MCIHPNLISLRFISIKNIFLLSGLDFFYRLHIFYKDKIANIKIFMLSHILRVSDFYRYFLSFNAFF